MRIIPSRLASGADTGHMSRYKFYGTNTVLKKLLYWECGSDSILTVQSFQNLGSVCPQHSFIKSLLIHPTVHGMGQLHCEKDD